MRALSKTGYSDPLPENQTLLHILHIELLKFREIKHFRSFLSSQSAIGRFVLDVICLGTVGPLPYQRASLRLRVLLGSLALVAGILIGIAIAGLL